MKKKPSLLNIELLSKKGFATPVEAMKNNSTNSLELKETHLIKTEKHESQYHKALTVKLDKERYRKLKAIGVELNRTSQEIFTESLDNFLALHVDKI